MPLFQIEGQNVHLIRPTNFLAKKQIQVLIERNLGTVFGCRLVATEFPTGQHHAGRIDTLALSEEGNPGFEEHLDGVSETLRELAEMLREFLLDLDESVEEEPKKFYVAYKVAQNFVCMEVQKTKLTLFLKLDPDELQPLASNVRDVRNIGHYGTGGLEVTIRSKSEIDGAKELIKRSYERVGG